MELDRGKNSKALSASVSKLQPSDASISKLQPSEICVTSMLTSPGHSTSKPMAPFARASMTSYSTLMVTMDLSASFSKVQPSEICLKCA